MDMAPTQEPELTARAELVAILEGLRDVLAQLDQHAIEARYVDFAEMANRVDECIDAVRELGQAG